MIAGEGRASRGQGTIMFACSRCCSHAAAAAYTECCSERLLAQGVSSRLPLLYALV